MTRQTVALDFDIDHLDTETSFVSLSLPIHSLADAQTMIENLITDEYYDANPQENGVFHTVDEHGNMQLTEFGRTQLFDAWCLAANSSSTSFTPSSYGEACRIPEWWDSMRKEMKNLIDNGTFKCIPRNRMPAGTGFVDTKFVYKAKFEDGVFSSRKSRLTARGFSQWATRDFDPRNIFAPVATFEQIRPLLAHCAAKRFGHANSFENRRWSFKKF